MRFWGHVPTSLRNKNIERHIPYLLFKTGFFGLQNFGVPFKCRGKNFFVNFECYDLANGEE
jgi:hypothetical protein